MKVVLKGLCLICLNKEKGFSIWFIEKMFELIPVLRVSE